MAKERKTVTQVKGKAGEAGHLEASTGGSLEKELVSFVAERKNWGENRECCEVVPGRFRGVVRKILCSPVILD